MRKELGTWTVLSVAFVFGLLVASALPGCQPKVQEEIPVDPGPPITIEEPEVPAEEPEQPAEEPAKPAEEPAKPAEEPAKPAEEPAKPAEEPAKPAEEPAKPAEEPAKATESEKPDTSQSPIDKSANPKIVAGPWPQWGGSGFRNNTPVGKGIAKAWEVGDFDRKTNAWISDDAENIKWVSAVGSQTYGNPVVADGKVFVGTNNGAGYLARYPSQQDLGCLLCFDEATGKFLWQHSSEKLPTGRVHDWPLQGICCAPYVEGDRLWFVTSRGEVRCLDTQGFHDGEDDGPDKAGWARLFDLMNAPDDFAAVASLKLTDGLRERFKSAGAELPEGELEIKKEGRSYTFSAGERDYKIDAIGPPNAPAKLSFFRQMTMDDKQEADVVWVFDMMAELKVSQHNMCSCSVTVLGDVLFVNTSNGLDESHINLPSPAAPSFIAMNKTTGEVYWTDASPGNNILHGQWSSPAVAELGGVPQVIFAGGDGWVYSFRADEGKDGKPELLWKFDANPKDSKWVLGGRGTRNNIIATPVIYDGLVYVAVGQDPEHGEGVGHLWCINPLKRGDVSPQLAVSVNDRSKPIAHRRLQAVIAEEGEVAVDNSNSAVIWHYSQFDQNGDGEIDFEEEMHRSCGTVAIKDDVLYIADFSGLFHCLNAKTGEVHFTYDMLAAAWGSPLIVDDHVYIGDEDGDVSVFKFGATEKEPIEEINMGNSVYSTPIVANNVLFIANKTHLFAIQPEKEGAE